MNIRGERILILGDSLSALPPYTTLQPTIADLTASTRTLSPGGALGKLLLADGAQAVRINARIGRSAVSFVDTENGLNQIALDLSGFRPTKVIVFFGTNDIDRGVTPDALAKTTTAMTQIRDTYRAGGAEVFAFGPPMYQSRGVRYAQGAPAMFSTIENVFGADHTLDLRPLTSGVARTGDGVHFTAAGAQQVAERIAAKLPTLGAPRALAITGKKIAIGALIAASFIGVTGLALYTAKRAAQSPRKFAYTVGRHALRYALKRR